MKKAIKDMVRQRAHECCEYCWSQASFSPSSFSIEHIIPLVKDGPDNDPGNLAFSCQGCNNVKFTITSAYDHLTNEFVPLYHPRQDVWSEHFAWSADFTHIIGLTPTGRATVDRLQINRNTVVNLRQALITFGKHPPIFE